MAHLRKLWVVMALISAVAIPSTSPAWAEYVAYAVTKKGELPLPENLDEVEDMELVNVKWGDYAGPQSRVGVMPVDNSSNVRSVTVSGPDGQVYSYSASGYDDQVPVNGIEAMLMDVMNKSGRFRILEREALGDVLDEQDLGDSGRVAKPSAAKIGKVLGAQYIVKAVVTSYEPNFKGRKGGIGGITRKFLGGAKGGTTSSMIGMNFRLIDAETSEAIFTQQIDVIMTKTEFGLGGVGWGSGGAMGGFFSGYSKTPIGQAVIAAINKGVFQLVKQLGSSPVEGSVVKADGGSVYLNLGEDAAAVGDVFEVFKLGEELIDPDTGISLGGQKTRIGSLKVVSVSEKFSIAEGVDVKAGQVERGDKVVSTKKAPGLQFAGVWEGKKN
jgi:curli biogenesis system outer membrane secretion channel CsgG